MKSLFRHVNAQTFSIGSLIRPLLLPVLALSLASCSQGERKIAEEERGTPTTVPAEQQLYREARETFLQWTTLFTSGPDYSSAYASLTRESARKLGTRGVRNAEEFSHWFSGQRSRERAPFMYTFSRFDLIDIDVTDTTRAIITASFLVDVHQSQVESIGSFFLHREQGRWAVPFLESGDVTSSWWQKEKNFARVLLEKGFSSIYSSDLQVQLDYPTAWDASELPALRIPGLDEVRPGIELSYLDPASLQRKAVMRIITRPLKMPRPADSTAARSATQPSATILPVEACEPTAEFRSGGRRTRIIDSSAMREIVVFTAVEDSSGSNRYQSTFNSIIHSITPTSPINDSTVLP